MSITAGQFDLVAPNFSTDFVVGVRPGNTPREEIRIAASNFEPVTPPTPSPITNVTEVSINYAVTLNDEVIAINASSGNVVITLPSLASAENKVYRFISVAAQGANTITINPAAMETINGLTSLTLDSENSSWTIARTASQWVLIDGINTINGTQSSTINTYNGNSIIYGFGDIAGNNANMVSESLTFSGMTNIVSVNAVGIGSAASSPSSVSGFTDDGLVVCVFRISSATTVSVTLFRPTPLSVFNPSLFFGYAYKIQGSWR